MYTCTTFYFNQEVSEKYMQAKYLTLCEQTLIAEVPTDLI